MLDFGKLLFSVIKAPRRDINRVYLAKNAVQQRYKTDTLKTLH